MRLIFVRMMVVTIAVICALADAAHAGSQRSVLRIGWANEPSTLNPFTALDFEPYFVWSLNWQLPIGYAASDNAPAAGVVQRWRTSADGRTTTYRLRPGLKWSDGQPLSSADVAFTITTLGRSGLLFSSYASNVTAVETPDPTTVVLRTRVPDVRLTDDIFMFVLPRHVWQRVPSGERTTSHQPDLPLVGSGPYVTTELRRGRLLRLRRNPHFAGPRPGFDEIQFIKYGTEDAVQRALRLGEVDLVTGLGPTTYRSLAGTREITRHSGVSSQFTQVTFNVCPRQVCPSAKANPVVQDVAVRRALAHAIDRPRIVEIAARGAAEPGESILAPFYRGWYSKPTVVYPFDPERARRILDAAGYHPQDDGIRARGEQRLRIRLLARAELPYNQQIARLIAEQARRVGIEIEVQLVSSDRLLDLMFRSEGGRPAPDFDAAIYDWQGDPYDPSFILSLLTSDELGASNDAHYVNPAYDELFAAQLAEHDHDRRRALIARMVAITQRDLPYLVVSYDRALQAYRNDRITGLAPAYPEGDGPLITPAGVDNLIAARPAAGVARGGSSGLLVALAVVASVATAVRLGRRRRRRDEPLELEG